MSGQYPQQSASGKSAAEKAEKKRTKRVKDAIAKKGDKAIPAEAYQPQHNPREKALDYFNKMDGLIVPEDCKKQVLERTVPDFYDFIKTGNPVLITKTMSKQAARASWYNELDKQHTFNTRDKVTALNCAMVKNALSSATNIFDRANIPPIMHLYLAACTERRDNHFDFSARDRFLDEWRKPSTCDIKALTQSQIRQFGQDTANLRRMRADQDKKMTQAEVLDGLKGMEKMDFDITTPSGERADRDEQATSQEVTAGLEGMEKNEMGPATLFGKRNHYGKQTTQREVSEGIDEMEMELDDNNPPPFFVDTTGEEKPLVTFPPLNKGDDEMLLAGDFALASGPAYNMHMEDALGKEKTDQELAEMHQTWVEGMYEALQARMIELSNMRHPDRDVLDLYLANMEYIADTGAEDELQEFKGKAEDKLNAKLSGLGMSEESEI